MTTQPMKRPVTPSRSFFGDHTPGAISAGECQTLLKIAEKRRAMRAAHNDPTRKCWKGCVFCA